MAEKGKDKIIKAAMELLLEKDITQITTREVVQKAGVNIALLHYHFKTKNDLFTRAIIESTQPLFEKWKRENINFNTPTREDLEKYVSGIINTSFLYPTISKSKIHLFLNGVNPKLFSFGLMEDLSTLISHLITGISNEQIAVKLHIIGQLFLSQRITNSTVLEHVHLDMNTKDGRDKYTTLILSELFPELYEQRG